MNDKVKTTKTPKTDHAKHTAIYAKPKKETIKEIPCADGKTKVVVMREYANGVKKSSLKSIHKLINGKSVKIG